MFDAVAAAKARHADVLMIDTAGRLHNKIGLMNELTKIKKVMQKVDATAPDEVLLVLDGSTGQNAYEQAKQFIKATEVTALAITNLSIAANSWNRFSRVKASDLADKLITNSHSARCQATLSARSKQSI